MTASVGKKANEVPGPAKHRRQPIHSHSSPHLLRRREVAGRRRRVPQQLVAPLPQRFLRGGDWQGRYDSNVRGARWTPAASKL